MPPLPGSVLDMFYPAVDRHLGDTASYLAWLESQAQRHEHEGIVQAETKLLDSKADPS
jgi:hypothetical protein